MTRMIPVPVSGVTASLRASQGTVRPGGRVCRRGHCPEESTWPVGRKSESVAARPARRPGGAGRRGAGRRYYRVAPRPQACWRTTQYYGHESQARPSESAPPPRRLVARAGARRRRRQPAQRNPALSPTGSVGPRSGPGLLSSSLSLRLSSQALQ